MSRRARGEGTIYRDGDRWVARVDLPVGPDGRRRQRKQRTRTKAEAVAALRTMNADIDAVSNPDGRNRTVADAADQWFRAQPADRRQQSTVDNWAWRRDMIKIVACPRILVPCSVGVLTAREGKDDHHDETTETALARGDRPQAANR